MDATYLCLELEMLEKLVQRTMNEGPKQNNSGRAQAVPISEKMNLIIQEAAEYSNIGMNKIRELANRPMVGFVLHVGSKTLIKRKEFEDFLRVQSEI